jgi:hypothetical protein
MNKWRQSPKEEGKDVDLVTRKKKGSKPSLKEEGKGVD